MKDDIQALIDLALSDQPDTKLDNFEKEVFIFIKMIDLKDGANPVHGGRVYEAYKRYKKKDFMSKKRFGAIFATYFKYRKFGNYKYYYLTPEPLGLPSTYTIYTDRKLFPKSKGKPYEKARKRREEKKSKEVQEAQEKERNKES